MTCKASLLKEESAQNTQWDWDNNSSLLYSHCNF